MQKNQQLSQKVRRFLMFISLNEAHQWAQQCAQLEEILFPTDSPWSAAMFRTEFAAGNTKYLGLVEKDQLIGYGGVAFVGPSFARECELHTIGIHPDFQGQGLGRKLLAALLPDEYPCFLEVRTDNEPALNLYQSVGFQVTGTRKNYYQPSGADAYTMFRPAREQ